MHEHTLLLAAAVAIADVSAVGILDSSKGDNAPGCVPSARLSTLHEHHMAMGTTWTLYKSIHRLLRRLLDLRRWRHRASRRRTILCTKAVERTTTRSRRSTWPCAEWSHIT
jgi:hypothetical protein